MHPPGGLQRSEGAFVRAVGQLRPHGHLPQISEVVARLHLEQSIALPEPHVPDQLPFAPFLGPVPGGDQEREHRPVEQE